jgi:hypothetical protein
MKIFFLIVFVLFFANCNLTAEWDIIISGSPTHYVSVADSTIHTIKISGQTQGPDGNEYFNFYVNEITSGTVANPTCVIKDGDGWLGRKVLFANDGSQNFENKKNESIKIQVNSSVGDKWRMMRLKYGNYLEAEILAIEYRQLFEGTDDSVKIIGLTERNNQGETVDSRLNELEFVLSKHYGMASVYNMYYFPDSIMIYKIKGVEGKDGLLPVKFRDIFNFEIGDEFHIYEGDTTISNRGLLRWRRIKVIDKTYLESENTYDYEVKHEVMQVHFIGDVADTVYNDNMVHLRYNLNNYEDYLPEESYLIKKYNDTILTSNLFFTGRYCGKQVINPWVKYERYTPPCYVKSNRSGEIHYSYIEGCGDFYEQDYLYEQKWRRLLYFKKDDCEWGKKLDFIVGVDEEEKNYSLHLMDKILDGTTPLRFVAGESGRYGIIISDITGRIIMNKTEYFNEGINLMPLTIQINGTYFIAAVKGKHTYFDKFNIIK